MTVYCYRCFTRADLIDEEAAYAMGQTGCVEVLIGCESGSDRILANVNKGTTRQQNLKAISLLKKGRIRVKAAIIIGLPGESWESIEETKSFIEEAEPDDVDFTILSVYPGSDIWRNPSRYDSSGFQARTTARRAPLLFRSVTGARYSNNVRSSVLTGAAASRASSALTFVT